MGSKWSDKWTSRPNEYTPVVKPLARVGDKSLLGGGGAPHNTAKPAAEAGSDLTWRCPTALDLLPIYTLRQ